MRLQSMLRKTIVFITHDFDEAIRLADRIAIMKDGAIIQIGTPEELVTHPADDYVADFTREIPRAKVLSVRAVMGEPVESWAGEVRAKEKVQEVAAAVARGRAPFAVLDEGGAVVGIAHPARTSSGSWLDSRPARERARVARAVARRRSAAAICNRVAGPRPRRDRRPPRARSASRPGDLSGGVVPSPALLDQRP